MMPCKCGKPATQRAIFKTVLLADRGVVYEEGDVWNSSTSYLCDDCSSAMFIQMQLFKPVPQASEGES